MRWAKIVLIFQAIVTLTLGIIFFSQVMVLDISKVSELRTSIENPSEETSPEYINLKTRYASAAYILLFVSLMELIIITKLLT